MTAQNHTSTQRQRLLDAQMTLAALVVEDSAFAPFFLRIERELALLNHNHEALERARALVRGTGSPQRATR